MPRIACAWKCNGAAGACMSHPFLDALRQALDGCQKQAACAIYPDLSIEDASARVSKVLAGRLNVPADLIDFALQGPHREPLLDYCRDRAERDPREIRRRLAADIEAMRDQLEQVVDGLAEADELERAAPIKIQGRARKARVM